MSDNELLLDRLVTVLDALEKIPRRFAAINVADDFYSSEEGEDRLDAICMILIAVGEAFKRIDTASKGALLSRYPDVDWRGVKGVRDVIAHGYFDVDVEEVFNICQSDIPLLIETVRKMIEDIRGEAGVD